MDDPEYSRRPRAYCSCGHLDRREVLKKPIAISLAFDHRCYRGVTSAAACGPPVSFPSSGAKPPPAPRPEASPTGRMTIPAADPARPRRVPKRGWEHREWFGWSLFPPSVVVGGIRYAPPFKVDASGSFGSDD